jgi:hypothetical protein
MLSLTAAAALAVAPTSALAHGDHHGKGPGHEATPVATVASFADGKLTLTLNDGSSLVAQVTDRTRLACENAAPPAPPAPPARPTPPTPPAKKFHAETRHHGHGWGRHRHQRCGTENLTAGTKVTDAEVSVTTSGAVFREVDLLK